MTPNSKLSERLAVLAYTRPIRGTSGGTITTTGFSIAASSTNQSASLFTKLLAVANVDNGTTSADTATIDIVKASDSALTGATAITGLSQTMSGTTAPVCIFDINSATQYLNDTQNTFIGLRVRQTAGVVTASGIIYGSDARYAPTATYNAGTLSTINSV
jgi:hypothetical protein